MPMWLLCKTNGVLLNPYDWIWLFCHIWIYDQMFIYVDHLISLVLMKGILKSVEGDFDNTL